MSAHDASHAQARCWEVEPFGACVNICTILGTTMSLYAKSNDMIRNTLVQSFAKFWRRSLSVYYRKLQLSHLSHGADALVFG